MKVLVSSAAAYDLQFAKSTSCMSILDRLGKLILRSGASSGRSEAAISATAAVVFRLALGEHVDRAGARHDERNAMVVLLPRLVDFLCDGHVRVAEDHREPKDVAAVEHPVRREVWDPQHHGQLVHRLDVERG